MSYELHEFATGDTLYAAELNEMDAQIRANTNAIALLNGETVERDPITFETQAGGYWDKTNSWVEDSAAYAKRTCLIPVEGGDHFAYAANSRWNVPSVIWFDSDENLLSWEQWTNPEGGMILYTAPQNSAYARFYALGYAEPVNLEVHYLYGGSNRQITIESGDDGYWSWQNVWVSESGCGSKRTNPIIVEAGDTFYYTGADLANVYGSVFYGSDGSIVQRTIHSDNGAVATHVITPPDDAVLVRFYSLSSETGAEGCTLGVSYVNEGTDEPGEVSSSIIKLRAMNCLWGKKYVACGDSFTEGDFTNYTDENGNSAKDSDAYDPALGLYKTYPWWIAERNRMILVNEAKCGTTMYNNGSASAFSVTRYTEVPADADYVTICFGLNETSATIGTLADTTNDTVMGAWNIVLEYLITNLPYAKIGIIIPDAWCSEAMREALIAVAEYWGIPYLDLTGDPRVPLLIGGKRGGAEISSKAIALRNAAFQVTDEDSHPNLNAHEYRSTIIEHFMRSL